MEVVSTIVNAAVIALVGLLLAWLGKSQSEAVARRFDERFDDVRQRFDALDQRFDAADQRINRLEERLDRRMDAMQTSIDGIRSDLTQVALAVGVRPRATNA